MTKNEILDKLKQLKPLFSKEGIVLLGLFGSYANNSANEDSDIDILVETTPKFLEKYRGFKAFSKLDEFREILSNEFNKNIDLVDKQGLLQHKNTYILDKTIYV
ncbi:MAG: nucleotidyltransferase domain-containing protein [Campylobacteraceae bacterium]|nr:nucleotidyltransferase domain-containing protein [Campylobacteraceae bacterium]